MQDPRDRAASTPPATQGEGCVRRYDLDTLSPQSGSEFADAAELWRTLQEQSQAAEQATKKGAE
jgi:hypothetical protein